MIFLFSDFGPFLCASSRLSGGEDSKNDCMNDCAGSYLSAANPDQQRVSNLGTTHDLLQLTCKIALHRSNVVG